METATRRVPLDVFVFHAAAGAVDPDALAIIIDPDGRHLGRAVGHDRGELGEGFGVENVFGLGRDSFVGHNKVPVDGVTIGT